ncbi:MAG: hypothetical protein K2G70_06305 [Turicibacter sp.]|nr:hypothetical protein [Turicibacter sp.]
MKKVIVFLLFIVVFIATMMYQENPCYYRKQFNRQLKKYRKQMNGWQDALHDFMPF